MTDQITDPATDPAVEAEVREILADVLNRTEDDLIQQPVLAAHRWDSISSLEALAALEGNFGVHLDLRSFSIARRVGDLAALIIAAGARPAAP